MTRVLIVDDDEPLRMTLRRLLMSEGYVVETAAGGTEALRKVALDCPDVVLTDVIMPNGDGVEFINNFKKSHPSLPLVAMSGVPYLRSLDLLNLVSKLGADRVLRKPFDGDELLAVLSELLEAKAQRNLG